MTGVDYNTSAAEYAAHRTIHAGVFGELLDKSEPGPGFCVFEVGCGTGNYAAALVDRLGCSAWGLDPSTGMLALAGRQASAVSWLQSRAEALPFGRAQFDLVFSVDVIHHVADRPGFFRQAARVLRPGGRVCTVTDSEEIIRRREILSGYFPETVSVELTRYPRLQDLEGWMTAAGLVDVHVVTVEVPYQINTAQPFRDKAYSSLHIISEAAWLAGLDRLEADLARGPVHGVSRYACAWGRRPGGV